MPKSAKPNKRMSASDARQHFSGMVNEIVQEGTRVVIEKNGAPVVAVVPIIDLIRLRSLDEKNSETAALLEMIGRPFRDVPVEEFEAEVEKIMAELREENRLARQHTTAKA